LHGQTITSTPSTEFGAPHAAADDDRLGTVTQLGEWLFAGFSLPVFRYLATAKRSFLPQSETELRPPLPFSSSHRDYEAYPGSSLQQEHREGYSIGCRRYGTFSW